MLDSVLLFAKGLGIGLAVAAPVGPVGALCIRRAVAYGKISAISSGLGAAVADSFYGAVAAFGLTAVSSFLMTYKDPAAVVGGCFLLWLAYRIYSENSKEPSTTRLNGEKNANGKAFFTTFLLTVTNPATILSFAAIFAGIGFAEVAGATGAAITMVVGVFLGSALWWVILAFFAVALKNSLGVRFTFVVNITSAVIIGLFGLAALVSVSL